MKSNFCNFRNLIGQKLCFKERSCWGNIQILLLIYLLRHDYLQHSSWLHSLYAHIRERTLQPTILPQNFERNWNLVFKSFDCAFKRLCKRIFLSFLSTHNRTEKKKGESLKILKLFSLHLTYTRAQNLISKIFVDLESENNK